MRRAAQRLRPAGTPAARPPVPARRCTGPPAENAAPAGRAVRVPCGVRQAAPPGQRRRYAKPGDTPSCTCVPGVVHPCAGCGALRCALHSPSGGSIRGCIEEARFGGRDRTVGRRDVVVAHGGDHGQGDHQHARAADAPPAGVGDQGEALTGRRRRDDDDADNGQGQTAIALPHVSTTPAATAPSTARAPATTVTCAAPRRPSHAVNRTAVGRSAAGPTTR